MSERILKSHVPNNCSSVVLQVYRYKNIWSTIILKRHLSKPEKTQNKINYFYCDDSLYINKMVFDDSDCSVFYDRGFKTSQIDVLYLMRQLSIKTKEQDLNISTLV